MVASWNDVDAPSSPARPVTVVVIAGTHVRLARLQQLLGGAGVAVVGVAKTADEAERMVMELEPEAVLLDLAMDAGGLDLVERVMSRRATPIVLTGAAAENAVVALAAGAVDVVAPGTEVQGQAIFARVLARQLRVASRVRVITHPRGRLRERGLVSAVAQLPPATMSSYSGTTSRASDDDGLYRWPPIVVIGASTGGPPALAALLGALPSDLPAPVVVVQHMAEGFVEGLVSWLDSVVALPVSVALNGDRLRTGHVVVAPSDGNLVVESGLRIRIEDPRPGQLHIPEIDHTLHSVVRTCRDHAVGVLLTGMGRDGAAGMLALRRVGGFTIGQDEMTSAVWGMPGAAAALDGLDIELPLAEIAPSIVDAVARLCIQQAV